jgi:hypothetical protein
MKRGLGLLILVNVLLTMPKVFAAETFSSFLTGPNSEDLLFYRLMFTALIFMIVYKGSKMSIFGGHPSEGSSPSSGGSEKNLAIGFSVLFSLFAFRFTPDAMIVSMGILITGVTLSLLCWTIAGLFFKGEDQGFNWKRLFLTLFGLVVLLIVLATSNSFTDSLSRTPIIGGLLGELFSDGLFYGFYGGGNSGLFVLIGLVVVVLLIGLVAWLLSRFGSGSGENSGFPWSLFFWMIAGVILFGVGTYLFFNAAVLPAVFVAYGWWILGGIDLIFWLWIAYMAFVADAAVAAPAGGTP